MKRIISLILIVCILSLFAVPAVAVGTTSFKMTADRTDVSPGDTVNFTVSLGAVEKLYGLKFKVVIPEGLCYVEGSGKVTEGLDASMNAAKVEFIESSMVFIVGACDYSSSSDTTLLQFQCTVEEDAFGSKVVNLEIDPENVFDLEYYNIEYTVYSAAVSVNDYCDHSWSFGDCENPKVCKLCGVVEGEASGHHWKEECVGDENGHWYDCLECDVSKIDPHTDGDGDQICDICGFNEADKDNGNVVVAIVIGAIVLISAGGVFFILRKKPKRK